MNGFGSMLKDYLEYHKISQTDFADRLGISNKHMNEILNNKTNLSLELMISISLITNIDVNLIYYVENKKRVYYNLINKYKDKKTINQLLNSYYINELDKIGWLKLKDKSSFVQKYLDLIDYLKVKDLDICDKYIDKRYLFKKKNDSNNTKVFLWVTHCDEMVKDIKISEYHSDNWNRLINELKIERMKKFNEESIIHLFHKYGILLYIENALPGTKIRGCSKVMMSTPVIYLTKYYKEKSSFYFALYHELMHIKRDYNMLKNKVMIDNDEKEIDLLALEEMIPNSLYQEILDDYSSINRISKEYNIPFCFIYTRLAMDGKISYTSKDYLNHIEKI